MINQKDKLAFVAFATIENEKLKEEGYLFEELLISNEKMEDVQIKFEEDIKHYRHLVEVASVKIKGNWWNFVSVFQENFGFTHKTNSWVYGENRSHIGLQGFKLHIPVNHKLIGDAMGVMALMYDLNYPRLKSRDS